MVVFFSIYLGTSSRMFTMEGSLSQMVTFAIFLINILTRTSFLQDYKIKRKKNV